MSATYTSVNRSGLQEAFGLAHKLSEDGSIPQEQRVQFRAIAFLIWEAHGESGPPPKGAGKRLSDQIAAARLRAPGEEESDLERARR